MRQGIARLGGSKKRCGVCLFELDPKTEHLRIDVDYDWETVFNTSCSHEFQFKHLEDSASRDCEKCGGIITLLKQCEVSFTTAQWWRSYGKWGPRPRLGLNDLSDQFELCVSPDHFQDNYSSVHPSICRGNRVAGHTGDDKALDQAATWLARCRSEHEQCQVKDNAFFPTRLLFIGREELGTVYLIENPSLSEGYAALSHRWSDETKVACLETSNLSDREAEGISLSTFPQMMQDVIFVLRRLGIRYVWIDSMCIIQNDKEDWRREAARMGSIYANAELTIAATWCNLSGQSLFATARKTSILPLTSHKLAGSPSSSAAPYRTSPGGISQLSALKVMPFGIRRKNGRC